MNTIRRLKQAAGANSTRDLREGKTSGRRGMRGGRGHHSLDNLKKYKRIGTKATGYDKLKDKINQSRMRMQAVRRQAHATRNQRSSALSDRNAS